MAQFQYQRFAKPILPLAPANVKNFAAIYPDQLLPKPDYSAFPSRDTTANYVPIVKPQPPRGSWYPRFEDIAREALNTAARQPWTDSRQGLFPIRTNIYGWQPKYNDIVWGRDLPVAALNGWTPQNLVPIPKAIVIRGWQIGYPDDGGRLAPFVLESASAAPLTVPAPTVVPMPMAVTGMVIRGAHVQYQQFARPVNPLAPGAQARWYPSFPDLAPGGVFDAAQQQFTARWVQPQSTAPTQFGASYADLILAPFRVLEGGAVAGFVPITEPLPPLGSWKTLYPDFARALGKDPDYLPAAPTLPIPKPTPPVFPVVEYPDFALGSAAPVLQMPQHHFVIITNVPVMSWTGSYPDTAPGPAYAIQPTPSVPPQFQRITPALSWRGAWADSAPGAAPVTHTNAVWTPQWSFPAPVLAARAFYPDYIFSQPPVIVNLGGQVLAIWPIPPAHANQYVGFLLSLGVG